MATETKRRAPGKRPARSRSPEPAGKGRGVGRKPRPGAAPNRLIAAAKELVRETGYESLSVGAVWKRAGVSHQTFYNHFPDKRAVICAAEHEDLAGIDAAVRRAQRRGDPWAAELSRSLERALSDLHGSTDTPRARLIAAMTRIAAAEGIKAASVHRLTKAAGVSAGDFQHYFSDRYDCLAAAVAHEIRRLEGRLESVPGDDHPLGAVQRRLATLIDSLSAEPHTAMLLLGEAGALSAPPHRRRGETDGPRGWAGSLRELVEARVLDQLAEVPEPRRRFAAGAIVASLRAIHLAGGCDALRDATAQIFVAALAPAAGSGQALTAAEGTTARLLVCAVEAARV